jgi:peroxiredoxin
MTTPESRRRALRALLPAGLLGACLIGAMPAATAAPAVGQPAPAFTATDVDGRTVRLADFRGRHVVLEWNNPGCPFVRKHYQQSGNLPALQKAYTARGVAWLAVNSTERGHADYLSPADLRKWFADRDARPTAVLMDESGAVGRAYGATVTPHMYVIDPQGRLAYAGGIDSIRSANPEDIKTARAHVREALDQALAGKPIDTPTSTPYGCSIKYGS